MTFFAFFLSSVVTASQWSASAFLMFDERYVHCVATLTAFPVSSCSALACAISHFLLEPLSAPKKIPCEWHVCEQDHELCSCWWYGHNFYMCIHLCNDCYRQTWMKILNMPLAHLLLHVARKTCMHVLHVYSLPHVLSSLRLSARHCFGG